jgi:hypothetical protein
LLENTLPALPWLSSALVSSNNGNPNQIES